MTDTTLILTVADMPAGDYAIVEAFGHRTLVGRVAEVERFGTKMLQVEPLFGQVMLGPILLGGGSIYQFTPVDPATAYARRPTENFQIPGNVLATVPPIALPSNEELPSFLTEGEENPKCKHKNWSCDEDGNETCDDCGLEIPF